MLAAIQVNGSCISDVASSGVPDVADGVEGVFERYVSFKLVRAISQLAWCVGGISWLELFVQSCKLGVPWKRE